MINSISNLNTNMYSQQAQTPKQTYDKDMFLEIMVAEMKYQNPMDPKSESDYMTQYAAFSQVEQMQKMTTSIQNMSAMNLIGKTVQVSTTDESGVTQTIEGNVDSVNLKNDKASLFINNKYYEFEDVQAIIDEKV